MSNVIAISEHRQPFMWMFPVPIDQLKPEPPAKIKGQDRPWSERDGALELIRDFTRETLLTCRQYAKRFNWGSNGHRYVADLIERLGFKVGSTRGQKRLILQDLDGRYTKSKPKNAELLSSKSPSGLPNFLATQKTVKPNKTRDKQGLSNPDFIHSNTHKNTQGFTDFLPTDPPHLIKENKKNINNILKPRVEDQPKKVKAKKTLVADDFYPADSILQSLGADYPEIGRPLFEAFVPDFIRSAKDGGYRYQCWNRAFSNWARRGVKEQWGFFHPKNLKRLRSGAIAESAKPRPVTPAQVDEARNRWQQILDLAHANATDPRDAADIAAGEPVSWDGHTLRVRYTSSTRRNAAIYSLHDKPITAWPFKVEVVDV